MVAVEEHASLRILVTASVITAVAAAPVIEQSSLCPRPGFLSDEMTPDLDLPCSPNCMLTTVKGRRLWDGPKACETCCGQEGTGTEETTSDATGDVPLGIIWPVVAISVVVAVFAVALYQMKRRYICRSRGPQERDTAENIALVVVDERGGIGDELPQQAVDTNSKEDATAIETETNNTAGPLVGLQGSVLPGVSQNLDILVSPGDNQCTYTFRSPTPDATSTTTTTTRPTTLDC